MSKTADVLTNYCDEDLTFFALTYKDYDAVAECLSDLRKHYSRSRVILRSDGDPDPRLPILAHRNQVDFRAESRLFNIQNGGAIIERDARTLLRKTNSILVQDRSRHRDSSAIPVSAGS